MRILSFVSLINIILTRIAAVSYNTFDDTHSAQLTHLEQLNIKAPSSSRTWSVQLLYNNTLYRIVSEELWVHSNGDTKTSATKGATYELVGQSWIKCGDSRLTFISTNDFHHTQGQFDIYKEVFNLVPSQLRSNTLNNFHSDISSLPEDAQYSVWKESDITLKDPANHFHKYDNLEQFTKRNAADLSIWPSTEGLRMTAGNISGCFNSPYIAPIGIVADVNFMESFNSTSGAYLHIADTVNKASQVWEAAFNITLSLSKIITAHDGMQYPWSWKCNVTDNTMESLQSRLNAVSEWSKREDIGKGLALWSLFTNCPSSTVIGLAWQSTSCTKGAANIIHHSILDYRVLAHEIGHIFGAVHDCTNTTCGTDTTCCPHSLSVCDSKGEFIMNPGSDTQQFHFSKCTQGNVCDGIRRNLVDVSCLVPQLTTPQIQSPQCPDSANSTENGICWRNMQCRDFTNSSQAYSCGSVKDCMLMCADERSQQCVRTELPLLDGTPCEGAKDSGGLCISGRCSLKKSKKSWPLWLGILVIVAATACCGILFATFACISLILYRRYKSRKLQPEPPNHYISNPEIIKSFISPAPRGLPPVLPYKSSVVTDCSSSLSDTSSIAKSPFFFSPDSCDTKHADL